MNEKMKEIAIKIKQTIRKYPLSSFFIILIWYLSFFTPPKTELDEVAFIDKWVHIAMYGGTFGTLWIEYLVKHQWQCNRQRLFLWSWLLPIVMSGCIELLQEYCTDGRRSGDWIDLIANALGVSLAALFGLALRKFNSK